MAVVTTRMEWRPATCRCVLEYALSRNDSEEDPGWAGATAVPDVIFEQCEAHAAAETAEDLEALIAPENEALAIAYSHIRNWQTERTISPDYTALLSWSIAANPETEVREVHITVSHADPDLQTALNAIDRIVATYEDTPGENGEREEYQNFREARSGTGRVLQGVRQWYAGIHGEDEGLADFFNICGNAVHSIYPLSYFPEEYVDGSVGSQYKSARHRVDFAMQGDWFSVRIDGHRNLGGYATQFAMYRNELATVQWVHVPANRMGMFTCIGDAEAFSAGDYVTGYRFSPAVDEFTEDRHVNSRVVTWEMLADSGTHSIYRTGEVAFLDNEGVPGNAFSVYPLSGSLVHYRSYITQEESTGIPDAEKPLEALIRAPGTYSYFQGAADPSIGRSALIGTRVNDHPPEYDWENAIPPIPYWTLNAADDEFTFRNPVEEVREAEVVSDDLFNSIGIDQPVGEGLNAIWGIGINWASEIGNRLIDHYVGECWVDSFDNVDGNRVDKFEFARSNPFEGDYDREWFASAIGEHHPRTRQEIEAMPLHWLDIGIFATFAVQVSRMRGHLDTNQLELGEDGDVIRIGVGQDQGAYGDVACDVGDPDLAVGEGFDDWYEDSAHTDEVQAYHGFYLRFVSPLAVTTAKAHISTVMFSYRPAPANRECLVRVLPAAVAVEPLPCGTSFARCVKITRTDGEVFAYTEHDRDLTVDGTTYLTCGAMAGSASQLGAVLGDVGNMEVEGWASDLGITEEDLFGGAFDEATVEVYDVPWEAGDTQPVRKIGGGTIGVTTQVGNKFTLEALTPSARLKQKALMETLTPGCRFLPLGSPRCGVDLNSLTVTGSVTEIVEDATNDATVRRRFFDDTRTEDDDRFAEGYIEFIDGPNVGRRRKVKASTSDGEVVLWEPFIYAIEVGHQYSMTPGCDGLAATCSGTYDNFRRFGGEPFIPGLDATSATPDPKEL